MASKRKSSVKADFMIKLGLLFLIAAFYIAGKIYLPIAKEELSYQIQKTSPQTAEIVPLDTNFGIVIPKINANAKVITNVNPFDSKEYQKALSKGVAHAKGSALPGETGNVFLFSHSSSDFNLATQYNSIFYLLDKLTAGDEVDLYYQNIKYTYVLQKKLLVKPDEISYLSKTADVPILTLMTCWPPGTTSKRLIAIFTLDTGEN